MEVIVIYTFSYNSPIGILYITEEDNYIIDISYESEATLRNKTVLKTNLISATIIQLEEYFKGCRKVFNIPIKPNGTTYMNKIWNVLMDIPYGKTLSYKEVATKGGNELASRAVGMACNRNPILILIPCHRVIGSNSKLVGFSCGIDKKEKLLDLENI